MKLIACPTIEFDDKEIEVLDNFLDLVKSFHQTGICDTMSCVNCLFAPFCIEAQSAEKVIDKINDFINGKR